MESKATSIPDIYASSPWLDWPFALMVTLGLTAVGLGRTDSLPTIAVAVSTLAGIFAATAVFACSAAVQSEALIMRVVRATFPRALMKTWVSIVITLMFAAALPIIALYLGTSHHRLAECVVLGAITLSGVTMLRVAWWIRYIARAEAEEHIQPHRTQVPEWMND